MIKSLPKDERFTPSKYINSIKVVLGNIDLDPSSCIEANNRIKADKIYTKEDSGLDKKWFGNVFCNPPYSRGNLLAWTVKILYEYEKKNFENGIYLVPNTTDASWFKPLWKFPICFTDHRINFLEYNPNTNKFYYLKNPENGSCFVLFGETKQLDFMFEFKKYGHIPVPFPNFVIHENVIHED